MGDRVHEVGLALPRARMEKQRTEADRPGRRHRLCGIERDLVRRIDDEPVEDIAGLEHRAFRGGRQGHNRCGRGLYRQRGGGGEHDRLRPRGCGFDRYAAHARKHRTEFVHQPIGIMAADPVRGKSGRQRKADMLGIIRVDELDGLEPLFEQPRAGRFAQIGADACPGLCHGRRLGTQSDLRNRHAHLSLCRDTRVATALLPAKIAPVAAPAAPASPKCSSGATGERRRCDGRL